jgi:outer membrane receptor protein involved in Fe transport
VRLESLTRATVGLLAAVGCALLPWTLAAAPFSGLLLEDAIDALEQDGLRIFYSTDLVRPWMRVRFEPSSADPEEALAEMLAPLGLATRPGPNGALLVIRGAASGTRGDEPLVAPETGNAPTQATPSRPLEEVVVSASQYEIRREIETSRRLISKRDIEYSPDIGDDAIRTVSRLPGTASSGFSARSSIRGGEVGETLVRFDGLRLYDPFHLKDFQSIFSAIDPRIVRSIHVYTGGFPASFGDRMSGVLDVETMSAPRDRYHEIGFSFFNSSVLSSGRLAGGRGEWLASIRRSNLDILYDQFSKQPERPRYTDAFTKLAYDVGERLKITANVLRFEDDISLSDDVDREERAEADYLDLYAWVGIEHSIGKNTSGKTLISRAALDSRRHGTSAKAGVSAGSLTDERSFSIATIQSEWSRGISDSLLMQLGIAMSELDGRYDYADEVELDLLFDVEGAPTETARSRTVSVQPEGRRAALYATLRYDWTDRVTAELGVRWDKQTLDRSETLAPRIGVRYALAERTDFRASWGRFYQSQAINELQVSDGVQSFTKPQRSDHSVLAIEHALANGIGLRFEAYEKTMHDLRPRYENLLNHLILLPELKPDRVRVAPSRARARGVELMLDSPPGPVQWWVGYSWSRVRDRIGELRVPRSWDQTHALTAGVNWDTAKWNLSFGVTYRSGWPISQVVLDDSGPTPLVKVLARNGDRLDEFRSVDMRATREIELARSSIAVSLEIINIFGRSNACCIEYEIGDEEETGQLGLGTLDYLPRIPSIGFLWKF